MHSNPFQACAGDKKPGTVGTKHAPLALLRLAENLHALPKQAIQTLKNRFLATVFALVFAIALARNARANLVQDADFTGVTYSGTASLPSPQYGQFGTETGSELTVANWTTGGFNFVYAPGTADVGTYSGANSGDPQEAPGQYNAPNGYGRHLPCGARTTAALDTLPLTDPAGGNFVAADGAYETGAISQVITGLTVGNMYRLQFYWAGAQQQSLQHATTEAWQVSLGGQTIETATTSIPAKGFSGWMQQTFVYTATNATETLSFLAVGTPNGQPPFSLLGGVDLSAHPGVLELDGFRGLRRGVYGRRGRAAPAAAA